MAPPPSLSIQASYNIIVASMHMGIGYMVTNQLNKIWLVENYKLNLTLVQNWADTGFVTPSQYAEYLRIGEVIMQFPVSQFQ